MTTFEIHPRLTQDTFYVDDFKLCKVLLMNDMRFPWLVLVPKRPGMTELYHLENDDCYQLMQEVKLASAALVKIYQADKLNVASIGNMVSQLHIHVVARYQTDSIWPHPVFGQGVAIPYPIATAESTIAKLKKHLVVNS